MRGCQVPTLLYIYNLIQSTYCHELERSSAARNAALTVEGKSGFLQWATPLWAPRAGHIDIAQQHWSYRRAA